MRDPRIAALLAFLGSVIVVPITLRAILGEGAEVISTPAVFGLAVLVAIGAVAAVQLRAKRDAEARVLHLQVGRISAEVLSRGFQADGWIAIEPALSDAAVVEIFADHRGALRVLVGDTPTRRDSRPLHVIPDRVLAATYWRDDLTLANVERWLPIVSASLARVGSSMTSGRIESGIDPTWAVVAEGGHWEAAEGPPARIRGSVGIVPPLVDLDLYGTWNELHDTWWEQGEVLEDPPPNGRPSAPFSVESGQLWFDGDDRELALENVQWWLPFLVTSLERSGAALANGVVERLPTPTAPGWRLVVEDGAWTIHELPVEATAPDGAG